MGIQKTEKGGISMEFLQINMEIANSDLARSVAVEVMKKLETLVDFPDVKNCAVEVRITLAGVPSVAFFGPNDFPGTMTERWNGVQADEP
jgi:hypothetical protein